MGMVVAFAGLLSMAVVDRVSARAGQMTACVVLLTGYLSIDAWQASGNLLPWICLQVGGMLLLLALAFMKAAVNRMGLPLFWVVVLYTLAKVVEMKDHEVFALTSGMISGHSLKHVVAAMAAWPVIHAVHNVQRKTITKTKEMF